MSGDVCVVVGADCIADFTMHMITSQRITRGLKVMGFLLVSRSCCVGSSAGTMMSPERSFSRIFWNSQRFVQRAVFGVFQASILKEKNVSPRFSEIFRDFPGEQPQRVPEIF